MAEITPSSREEFRQHWRVLLAAALGTTCSAAAFATASLTFLVPFLDKEMGWRRQDVSTAASIFLVGLMIFAPIAGRLCDRWGARAIALPSIALTVLALLFLSTMTTSLPLFYAGYFLLAIGGAGANFVIYSRAVASRFDAMRGLALGTVIASTGITIALVPFIVVRVSDQYGWRSAYLGLALLSGAAALIVYPWLREAKVPRSETRTSQQGMTFAEVRRTPRFWTIAVALLLMSPAITGAHFHFIPLYSEKGLSREGGQVAMACFGVSMVFARPLIGFLLDKLHAPLVVAVAFCIPGLALLLVPQFGAGFAIVLAIALGLGMSAEGDVVGFLTSRYFGMRAFSETYGWLIAAATLGFALGPVLAGKAYEVFGSYDLARNAGAVACLLAATAFLSLEPLRRAQRTAISSQA